MDWEKWVSSRGEVLFDQRGEGFPRISGGRIDMGAFEFQYQPPELLGDYNQTTSSMRPIRNLAQDTAALECVPFTGTDGDGNGMIEEADYGVWRPYFGQTMPAGAGAGSDVHVAESLRDSVVAETIVSERQSYAISGAIVADPHPLDSSRPLPKGEVFIPVASPEPVAPASQPPALPGVSEADKLTVAGAQTRPPAEPGAVVPIAAPTIHAAAAVARGVAASHDSPR